MNKAPRFDLRLLRAAVAVRDAGSVTLAARRLGTSQPALSRVIARLEEELGFTLFSRSERRLRITSGAELFLNQAAATLVGADRLGQLAQAIRAERIAKVKIASPAGLFHEISPNALRRFAHARPGVEIEAQIRRRHEIFKALDNGEIDFGVAILPVGQPGLKVSPFASREAVCFLPASHPLASAVIVTPADLAGMDQVTLPEGSVIRGWVEDAFAAASIELRRRFTVDSNLMAVRLVAAGLGFAIMHPVSAESLVSEVTVRAFRPTLPFTYALIERADVSFGVIARELLDALHWSAIEADEDQ